MITFSFNPSKVSTFPSIAASVNTLVVSWKLAADMKLSVFREDFVMPNKLLLMGLYPFMPLSSYFLFVVILLAHPVKGLYLHHLQLLP